MVGAIQYYYCHHFMHLVLRHIISLYTLAIHRISKNNHKSGSKIHIIIVIHFSAVIEEMSRNMKDIIHQTLSTLLHYCNFICGFGQSVLLSINMAEQTSEFVYIIISFMWPYNERRTSCRRAGCMVESWKTII